MKIVITSGYYDPLHIGHIRCFEAAKLLGDYHIAIVNNDKQAELKKGKPFMPQNERLEIVKALRCVDEAVLSIDENRTQNATLEMLANLYKGNEILFAKGGDYDGTIIKCAEEEICRKYSIEIFYNVGGEKIQSSSWLVKGWTNPTLVDQDNEEDKYSEKHK